MSIYWVHWEAEKCQKTHFLGKNSTALWQFCWQPISIICTILNSGCKGLSILNVAAGSAKIQLTLFFSVFSAHFLQNIWGFSCLDFGLMFFIKSFCSPFLCGCKAKRKSRWERERDISHVFIGRNNALQNLNLAPFL